MLDAESEQIREVYALFGLAIYLAQNLERELAMALAVSGKHKPLTAWDYDARLAENFASTFGALSTRFVEAIAKQNPVLAERISKAVDSRNDLAHHYFWNRAVQFCSAEGRNEMITELQMIGHEFESLDDEVTDVARNWAEQKGLAVETLQAHSATIMEEMLNGSRKPYDPELVPNPVEIVAAYEWRAAARVKSKLVLEAKDGRYLLLGEKGLCYGPGNIPATELSLKTEFQKALPAQVNPRPKTSVPWNFALLLENGYILRARRDDVNGNPVIRFGLRRTKP